MSWSQPAWFGAAGDTPVWVLWIETNVWIESKWEAYCWIYLKPTTDLWLGVSSASFWKCSEKLEEWAHQARTSEHISRLSEEFKGKKWQWKSGWEHLLLSLHTWRGLLTFCVLNAVIRGWDRTTGCAHWQLTLSFSSCFHPLQIYLLSHLGL